MGRMLPVYPVLHGVAGVLGQIGLGTYADVGSNALEWDEQLAVTKEQYEAPVDRMFATMEHITDGGLGAYPDPTLQLRILNFGVAEESGFSNN